jgi:selenocysteine lyase/cysteine desulfurase
MDARLSIEDARAEFASLGDTAYLDTPSQGVPCAAGTRALTRAVDAWRRGAADFDEWEADADAARGALAALLGAAAADIALVPSIAHMAGWLGVRLRGTVLVPAMEYRSNLYPWLATREAKDVRLVEGAPLTDRIVEAIDERTSLVAVSSIQSLDGTAVDLDRVVAAAHAQGALVFVDATQSLGVTGAGLAASGADVICAAGYKWLLGGRGCGYAYVRPELQELIPVAPSPRAAADRGSYGPPLALHGDARRFDGSLAWHAWVAARPGVELLARVGAAELERHALALAGRARAGLTERGLGDRLAPRERPTQILAVRCEDPAGAVAALAQRGVRAAARGDAVRFGFHLFNTDEHADRLVEGLHDALSHDRGSLGGQQTEEVP